MIRNRLHVEWKKAEGTLNVSKLGGWDAGWTGEKQAWQERGCLYLDILFARWP